MAKRKPPPTLEELNNMLWKDYMKSRHWIKFRKALDTNDASCEICGKIKWELYKTGTRKGTRKKKPTCQFHTHHLHYNHLGEETREDVLYLCSTCHSLGHDLEMASRTRGGVFTIMYTLFKEQTIWRYEPYTSRKR